MPNAVKTKLGWTLRGATKVLKQIPVASVCSVIADNNKNFNLKTMQKSM